MRRGGWPDGVGTRGRESERRRACRFLVLLLLLLVVLLSTAAAKLSRKGPATGTRERAEGGGARPPGGSGLSWISWFNASRNPVSEVLEPNEGAAAVDCGAVVRGGVTGDEAATGAEVGVVGVDGRGGEEKVSLVVSGEEDVVIKTGGRWRRGSGT